MREYLKTLRNENNLTQLETAKKLDISESYYCQIENGERQKKFDIGLAQKLADVFGVTLEFICEQETKAG